MSRTFSALSRNEATVSAIAASVLSVATIGVVLAAFSTAAPVIADHDVVVVEHITISAPRMPA